MMEMTVAQQWSELPEELLNKIAKCLTVYGDYIRFRAVCVSWQSALPKTPIHLPRQFPLLLLPHNQGNDTGRDFFSLADNKSYRLDFQFEVHKKFLRGSCHGWLVTIDDTGSVGLFNPLTGAHIELPSISGYGSQGLLKSLYKVVLSSNPSSSDDDFMAIAILGSCMLFCRSEDNSWTTVKAKSQDFTGILYTDVIFYKQQIFAVRADGVVIMDVIGGHGNSTPTIEVKQILRPPISVRLDRQLYLVESDDDLLIVSRSVHVWSLNDCRGFNYRTAGCAIYKLDLDRNRRGAIVADWSKVNRLGDRILLLGLDTSSSFSASDFPGCRGNCIYFTDDLWNSYWEGHRGGCDVTLFDLGDQRIKQLPGYH